MKALRNVVIITIALVVFYATSWANNPADQTASYGQYNFEFYKICFDAGGSQWFDFGFPVSEDKTSSVYIDNWVSKDGESRNFGFQFSHRFPEVVSITFVNNLAYGNSGSSSLQDMWVDFRWDGGGVSILSPFERGGDPTFGIRSDKGPLTAYLQYAPDETFFSGLSYEFRDRGITFDVAYQESSEITFVRLSKVVRTDFGLFVPEIRTKLGENDYIGFGLACVPN